jgi:hypothetical protein
MKERLFEKKEWKLEANGIRHPNAIPGNPIEEDQVEIAKKWLAAYCPKGNHPGFSYTLKHLVEETHRGMVYMSNGAMIKAALDLGYTVRVFDNGLQTINANILVDRKAYKGLQKERLEGGPKKWWECMYVESDEHLT